MAFDEKVLKDLEELVQTAPDEANGYWVSADQLYQVVERLRSARRLDMLVEAVNNHSTILGRNLCLHTAPSDPEDGGPYVCGLLAGHCGSHVDGYGLSKWDNDEDPAKLPRCCRAVAGTLDRLIGCVLDDGHLGEHASSSGLRWPNHEERNEDKGGSDAR